MSYKILLAEDNESLREVLTDYLSDNGFCVDVAEDGLVAWTLFQENKYDLVLLDVMMPEMDGFEVCRNIRTQEDVPILFLTAKVQEQDQLTGFSVGADDYIVKPFSLAVLLAKCNVILERRNGNATGGRILEGGAIKINLDTHEVFLNGKPVELQALDYEMLCYFASNPGRTFTRDQLLTKLWGYDYDGSDRAVDTHVKKLRKQLGKYGSCIKTVIKTGYKFEF